MDIELLKQEDWIKFFREKHGVATWVSVYKDIKEKPDNGSLWCGLLKKDLTEQSLQNASWDFHVGAGGPGFTTENGVTEYHRDTSIDAEQLVIARHFHGVKSGYKEIAEEFRLFHNLYFDSQSSKYIKILESGEKEDAAIIEDKEIRIRLRLLKQYISAKQMTLALYFDIARDLPAFITEEDLNKIDLEVREDNFVITRYAGNCQLRKHRSFSRLLGKKLIYPELSSVSEIWPGNVKRQYQSYIFAIDEHGRPKDHTCNPDELANGFGGNPHAPPYLTPIFFKTDVLTKYYNKPSLYSIEDSYLRCAELWGLGIDNNHKDYVCVFLGDLGNDLPESEQIYWRSFNVSPEGSISNTYFRRSFLAEFTGPEKEDLILKSKLSKFNTDWKENYGWQFFLPLDKKDQHLFNTLRIPLSEEQSEFDNQILALTKVVIDSLNEAYLSKDIENGKKDIKGITKLEMFLKSQSFPGYEDHIQFLRDLYDLRSSGTGHRKGREYEKTVRKLHLECIPLQAAFVSLCKAIINFLDQMRSYFLKGKINSHLHNPSKPKACH